MTYATIKDRPLIRCIKCDKMLPHKGFYPSRLKRSRYCCKTCDKIRITAVRAKTPYSSFKLKMKRISGSKVGSNIDASFLLTLWHRQEGKCALSGLPMTWVGSGPTNISVDRINPKKGYTKDNVRLLCWAVNSFKLTGSDEQMIEMARAVVAHADSTARIKVE